MQDLVNIVNNFQSKKVLVIGDLMLDKYIYGDVDRISPEAPVQIVKVIDEEYRPGGAANVANNIASFNAIPFLVGYTGKDKEREVLLSELKKRKIKIGKIIADRKRSTIVKTRVMSRSPHPQQLLRIDYENTSDLDSDTTMEILDYIRKVMEKIDIVVISDYAKGLITKALVRNLQLLAVAGGNKKVLIDPKLGHQDFYWNTYLITPNQKEACEISGLEFKVESDIIKIGKKLTKELSSNVLITRGERGMTLFKDFGRGIKNIPTKAREVYDVTGAGDTVIATMALALASGASLEQAAVISNYAAGIKVSKVGTATVNKKELQDAIKEDFLYFFHYNNITS